MLIVIWNKTEPLFLFDSNTQYLHAYHYVKLGDVAPLKAPQNQVGNIRMTFSRY